MTATEETGPPALTAPHDQVDANRDEIEQAAALPPGILLRGAEVGMALFVGLLVCPPLAILVVVVIVPLLALAIVAGLIATIVAMPYLLVREAREHHRRHHTSALAHGLRRLRAREA